MFDEFLKKTILVLGWCGIIFGVGKILFLTLEIEDGNQPYETTTAKPVYQQQIGDDTEPDILIIYEAEVDGVKVYPSVIKEAK